MSSASFDLLPCEVTSSPPRPCPRSQVSLHICRPSETGRLRKTATAGRGGGRAGPAYVTPRQNRRVLPSTSCFGIEKAGRDAGTIGQQDGALVPSSFPTSSVGVGGYRGLESQTTGAGREQSRRLLHSPQPGPRSQRASPPTHLSSRVGPPLFPVMRFCVREFEKRIPLLKTLQSNILKPTDLV